MLGELGNVWGGLGDFASGGDLGEERFLVVELGELHLGAVRVVGEEGGRLPVELVHLPGGCADSIKLAQDPQRDRDIDEFCRSIENAGKAGLRGICWHCAPSTAFAALSLFRALA